MWYLIYSRLSTECAMLVFFRNSNPMEFQVGYLALLRLSSVIDSFRWFWMGSLHKSIQSKLELLKASFLVLLQYINDLPDVICKIVIYADDTTVPYMCHQPSDLWQQLELTLELESDLQDTVDVGRKWLFDFNARKTQPVSFHQSNNSSAIDVKVDRSVLAERSSFKMLGLSFPSKLGILHCLNC